MPIRLRYPEFAPEGYAALSSFGHYINTGTSLEPVLIGLVNLCASKLNRCEFCIGLHAAELRRHHEPQERIDAIEQWRTSEAFTPRERAALAWTEAITNIQGSHASDEDYAAVTEFFRDKELVDLTYAIANINAWNRLGVAFRPEWRPGAKPKVPPSAPEQPEAELQPVVGDDGGKIAED